MNFTFVGAKKETKRNDRITEIFRFLWMMIYRKSAGDVFALRNGRQARSNRACGLDSNELNHTSAQCNTSDRHTSPLRATCGMHPSTTTDNSFEKIAVFTCFLNWACNRKIRGGLRSHMRVRRCRRCDESPRSGIEYLKVQSRIFSLTYDLCFGKSLTYHL